jgi:hypothetical protein
MEIEGTTHACNLHGFLLITCMKQVSTSSNARSDLLSMHDVGQSLRIHNPATVVVRACLLDRHNMPRLMFGTRGGSSCVSG